MSHTVGALHGFVSAGANLSVEAHEPVIANTAETALTVAAIDVSDAYVAAGVSVQCTMISVILRFFIAISSKNSCPQRYLT